MTAIFALSSPGKNRKNISVPDNVNDEIPASFINEGIDLPDVGEPQIIRHYTRVSTMNFGVDSGMYPLGSCTMKYNPKINERMAGQKEFSQHHPFAPDSLSQGTLEILYNLNSYLCSITGMSQFTSLPAAGSHGELSSVMIIKKYFEKKGENRDIILIPDTAHGTNPASVAMCGFKVREVKSDKQGNVDLAQLKEVIDENVAGMMLTSPNTLGLFDTNISTIASMLHEAGALFYCDGANLNAIMGYAKIADMGFDIMHVNLHKTFSTPHGGGGPGSGPIGVVDKLKPYLPVPDISKKDDCYELHYDNLDSIGRIHSFYGNVLIALRAYVYIRMLGPDGIKEVSEYAVLNANYLLAQLKDSYNLPIDRTCMHEFVLNDEGFPNNVTTNDIGKRLLDYSIHAPTVYFPLLIKGALMIEPTETENKCALDRFIHVMKKIKKEAQEQPDLLHHAPVKTPVARVDAVSAARKPILTWDDRE